MKMNTGLLCSEEAKGGKKALTLPTLASVVQIQCKLASHHLEDQPIFYMGTCSKMDLS